jgi:spermidine synthase
MLVFFHLLLASFVLLTIPFFDYLPFLFKHLHRWFSQYFGWFQFAQFIFCFFVIFVPTFMFGAIFPLANRLLFEGSNQLPGAAVGKLYALNTIGAIVGSLVSGFVFISLLGGIQPALRAIASAHFLMGAILIWILPTLSFSKKAVIAICFSGVLFLTAFFEKAWDPALLYSGMYLYAPKYSDNLNDWKEGLRQGKILFHKEGIHATVTVKDFHKDWLVLFINGKGDASSWGEGEQPGSDFASQCLVAHIPSLLHPNPRSAAVIGLGSGATVGAALSYPLQEIDVIEISPEVIEASRLFSRANDHALDDPRVRLIVQDARQYLLATQKRYDLILSEPSNPWITGISNLFTKDHYEILKARLQPGGAVAQWLHYYSMNETDFKIALKTFLSVFRYVTLWDVHYGSRFAIGDVILIGSEIPLMPLQKGASSIEERMKSPRIHAALSRIGRGDFDRLIDLYMMDEIDLDDYTRRMPLNTDDFPMIEFQAPKSLVLDSENKYRIRKGFEWYKFSKRRPY